MKTFALIFLINSNLLLKFGAYKFIICYISIIVYYLVRRYPDYDAAHFGNFLLFIVLLGPALLAILSLLMSIYLAATLRHEAVEEASIIRKAGYDQLT